MKDFIFALNTVAPTFLIIFLGYILLRVGMINETYVRRSSAIIFRITLPLLVFSKMRTADFAAENQLVPLVVFLLLTFVCVAVVWLIAHYMLDEGTTRGAFVQGSFRSNIAIIGIPIVTEMLGEGRETLAVLILAFIMPVYNVLAVIVLSVTAHSSNRPSPLSVLFKIIRNPLIVAVIAGVCARSITVPVVASRTVLTLAQLTFPLALLGIGASLGGTAMTLKAPLALLASAIKTVLLPLGVSVTAWFCGVRDERLAVLLVVSGSPAAVSSFIMAKAMHSDGELAAGIVFFSTLMAMPVLALGIYVMRILGAV